MFTRMLGRSGIEISALGLGCWAIGGPAWRDGNATGWGVVDDNESIAAIHRALDLGVNFLDTANSYGCGHSERVIGQAVKGRRDKVVIATKFNAVFDEKTRQGTGFDTSPAGIRSACDASLARLQTDYIDIYQFHDGMHDLEKAVTVREVLEGLVAAGKIRWYGWSTDNAERARLFAAGEHCTSVQQAFNIFRGDAATLEVCEAQGLASIIRSPLEMGMLSGKYKADSKLAADDIRSRLWNLSEGEHAVKLAQVGRLAEVLTEGGRSMVQGALGWLWARSAVTLPIPGFRTVAQVEENAGALDFGPLSADQMTRVKAIVDAR